MSDEIKFFDEHGGMLYCTVGRVEMVISRENISVERSKKEPSIFQAKFRPAYASISVNEEEANKIEQYFAKPTVAGAASRLKSAIYDLAYSGLDRELVEAELVDARSLINKLIKEFKVK